MNWLGMESLGMCGRAEGTVLAPGKANLGASQQIQVHNLGPLGFGVQELERDSISY